MTTTPILGITQVMSNQNQKEVTINDAIVALEAAGNDAVQIAMTTSDVTVTSATFAAGVAFQVSGATTALNLIVPAVNRLFLVINANTANLTVKCTTGTNAILATGTAALLYCDGTNILALTAAATSGAAASYSSLPAQVQNNLLVASISGKPTASQVVFTVPIAQTMIIPANFAGSVGYAGTAATATAAFTLSYIRSGTSHTIGTLTFAASGTSATLSTQAAVSLNVNDILILTAPSTVDTTLANIGLTLLTTKE